MALFERVCWLCLQLIQLSSHEIIFRRFFQFLFSVVRRMWWMCYKLGGEACWYLGGVVLLGHSVDHQILVLLL
ncbi:hypothetical protein KC19_2G202300 [Ceratodon purpureus]|uniref:Uncharacterized protein n=1 Tax=Ceratodon purpureus TaxID=3225 RepID=A0A8T0IYG9_CERPU|nr:hypothetical protein KC19_2G202300 [Ceratodon purpureus]